MNLHSANILIVDDQIVNVKLLEKVFQQEGFTNIFSTTDSREAVTLYLEHDIDVLLLDIRMPHIDGFEVMAELDSFIDNDYLPILVLTAELEGETRSKALSSGAKDFLTKPFDRLEVIQRTKNIIEVRMLHKQINHQNRTLEATVKERTKELEESQLEVIERLGLAAEYKDNETGNHVIRMSQFSYLLAKAMGLSEEGAELLKRAAPMHDLGKIGIPDRVLLKPGKLDKDEWKIMKTHVDIGGELLKNGSSPLLVMAKSVALTHHEKWDGSGYPNGLSGEDIPIEGRICAISDVFDALTSKRPYKEAWPVEKAMDLIKSESGKHFEPRLVELFVKILPSILLEQAKYQDV